MICEEVFGAQCTILAPASWCWPSPVNDLLDRLVFPPMT